MLILLVFIFIVIGLLWLIVEYFQSSSLNGFLDLKIMRRFLWLWLPFYALWRLSKDVLFSSKKK